jgi:multidrug efflux pump subunit AcrA (membrane-fusion protein)
MLIAFSALLAGCGEKKEEQAKEGDKEKAPEAESHVKHGTNGEVIVTVEGKMQPTIGLQTSTLQPAQVSPELKAYGHVLDPSPLASIVAELVSAEAAGQASAAELARLKTLAPQGNASERAVQNAQAAAVHDQAQIQAIRLRLLVGWGSGISQRTDLPDFIQSLGSLTSAIVELEVPAGETFTGSPTGARLFTLGDQTNAVAAQLIGPAPNVDPQMQGRGFLLLVSPNPLRLAPGAAVTGLLSLPGVPRTGVLLPREAVVWFNGLTWAYFQVSDDSFQREQVTLDTPLDNGWFVASGLKAQDKVVTTGGQQLLSEELKGQLSGD